MCDWGKFPVELCNTGDMTEAEARYTLLKRHAAGPIAEKLPALGPLISPAAEVVTNSATHKVPGALKQRTLKPAQSQDEQRMRAVVKGPIRCHNCQMKCVDAEHYLVHDCVPRRPAV
jgi:hypothetical protein